MLVYQRVNLHFPMVFLWFSYGFPMVFPFKPSIFPWFPSPMVTLSKPEAPRATSLRFGAAPHGVAPTSGLPGIPRKESGE